MKRDELLEDLNACLHILPIYHMGFNFTDGPWPDEELMNSIYHFEIAFFKFMNGVESGVYGNMKDLRGIK